MLLIICVKKWTLLYCSIRFVLQHCSHVWTSMQALLELLPLSQSNCDSQLYTEQNLQRLASLYIVDDYMATVLEWTPNHERALVVIQRAWKYMMLEPICTCISVYTARSRWSQY
jgi:hypothetical protein